MAAKTPSQSPKPLKSKASRDPSSAQSDHGSVTPQRVDQFAKAMRDSLLPGDTPFSGKPLEEAARFVLEAAASRDPQRSAITISSASDERRFTRLAIVNDDMPFLVDSVAAAIAAQRLAIDRLVHPVVKVERDSKGTLTDLSAGSSQAKGQRESLIYIETDRVDARDRRELEKELRLTLMDVGAAVVDWPKLQDAMREDAAHLADEENAALLEWFNSGMLTQLGHVTRQRDGGHAKVLGVCRKGAKNLLSDESYQRAFAWFDDAPAKSPRELLVVKANQASRVHRRVPLDLFIVPQREDGKVTALSVHAGVWTSAALATPPAKVPVLRSTLHQLTERLGFAASSHDGKALVHALTALPHDLLVGFASDDVARLATTMMGLVDRPRPRLALVTAPLARHVFAFVWLPRDMLATRVRHMIQDMLTEGDGIELLDWSLEVEGGNLAMLRFVLDIRAAADGLDFDQAALEARLQDMLRGWGEAVERHLAETEEAGRAAAIATRHANEFPIEYRERYSAAEAARDLIALRSLNSAPDKLRSARFYGLDKDPDNRLRLKIYQHEGALPLSDVVPALENFGFRVIKEIPTVLAGTELGSIHEFTLDTPEGSDAESVLERADAIEDSIAAVLNGHAENDAFNRLVVNVGLSAEEADWLRAFYRYLRQTGMSFTIYTVVDALSGAQSVTRALIDQLRACHQPDFKGNRDDAAQEARDAIKRGLAKVNAINDDRLLRLYQALIEAILRTNVFAPAAREALAFKIDSSLVPNLPKPIPWREIWVYSRRVEGIHLRAGPIARGGLRWSDRRDDFRTEILGLMKAQRVKNAVIVPTGAKGGFYPKQLPSPARDREAWAAEGQASYEVFIRTLLSVTDNLVNGKVVHPANVVIRDGEDPYFVVAADKGTAKFSDIANAIAERAGFWLGDAFASGGSNGYDHKAMGITARGAWVSVQRHFLEQGVDVQKDTIRVAGCGDMSGDVFGNGMLLSKAIQLVAAFDHRHIFIDPDPDPAKSWKERKRMFELSRSSWDDYDKGLISKGGGVYSRDAKSIKLSKPAQKALGVEQAEWEPEALIRAILTSPVDLLWFGGIGTYIKASSENNASVGDPGNDLLRVDARDLNAKVIGEGANLAITQAGRIEFGLNGGRGNTDFIDNSAGVDCSDNEVNIKIALADARRADKLSEKRRIALLEEMTDDVADIVLEDNRLQALALSVAESSGPRAMDSQIHLIETLEQRGALDRKTEGLADNQTLSRRAADGQGLTRPELAVLLSSTKLVLQDAIENSRLPQAETLKSTLVGSFPSQMREDFAKQIAGHQLRAEIVATKLANRIVNRLGIIHPFELAEEEGVDLSQVAASFVAVETLFDLPQLWTAIEEQSMPEQARLRLLDRVAAATANLMSDVLRTTGGKIEIEQLAKDLGDRINTLSDATDRLIASEARKQSAALCAELRDAGAPEKLANAVATLFDMDGATGLAQLAFEAEIDAEELTRAFTTIGERLGLGWAQSTAAMMNPSDIWERPLVSGLARDFQQMRLEFLRRQLRKKSAKNDPQTAVENWTDKHEDAIAQFRSTISRAQAQTPVSPVALAQIASQARNLLER
ncbi:NAD-glutamate dehydrogenase [Altererythrobacter sp. GH1-8]|uniref:NAD-glutamate dehydrogenase n=1 Tax=Altererythrobacter sp. GH1-8 TaxID=3349333 RepID=UPI00374DAB31